LEKLGLENKLDPEMVGSIGYKRYEVNAFGKRIREISISQGQSGKTFKTTLDLELQKFSTKLLKDKAGSVCVMDIYKGDIVIMALHQFLILINLFMVLVKRIGSN
jgi:penicillin-binding protein 2